MAETGDRMRLATRVYRPEERERARAIFAKFDPDVHTYDGLVTGWGDTDVARQLMDAGFFIDASSSDKADPIPQATDADLLELRTIGVPDALYGLAGSAGVRLVRRGDLARAAGGISNTLLSRIAGLLGRPPIDPTRKMYEVRLTGPMRPEWGRKLESTARSIASYAPPFRCRMLLEEEQLSRVHALDFVHSVARYSLSETLGRTLLKELQRGGDPREGSKAPVELDLTVRYPSQAAAIRRILKRMPDFKVIDALGSAIHFTAPIKRSCSDSTSGP